MFSYGKVTKHYLFYSTTNNKNGKEVMEAIEGYLVGCSRECTGCLIEFDTY